MKFIGITGGVGAGKSSVLTLLRENCNCKVLLADEVAATLMTPGHSCYDEVVALDWPHEILDDKGIIDRPAMAKGIFLNPKLREEVNAIVHPAVEREVLNQVEMERNNHNIEYFFFEAALLLECGYGKLCDEVWYVYASEEVRRQRLKANRGYSDERIDAMLKSQLSDAEFRKQADFVIDNGGDRESTLLQLRKILG